MANTGLIEQHWNGVRDRSAVVEGFYARLFDRHPDYRRLFPEQMGHQMEKMVETLALVAGAADAPALIRPRLLHLGRVHSQFGLGEADFREFFEILIEVLAEHNVEAWSEECARAWHEAVEHVLLPCMLQGLQGVSDGKVARA